MGDATDIKDNFNSLSSDSREQIEKTSEKDEKNVAEEGTSKDRYIAGGELNFIMGQIGATGIGRGEFRLICTLFTNDPT